MMDDLQKVGRFLISDAEFNRLLMELLDWVQINIQNREFFNPHLFAFFTVAEGGYDVEGLTTPGFIEAEVRETVAAMGTRIGESDGQLAAAFLVTEGWMVPRSGEENQSEIPPAEDPRRIEVVIISGSTLDQRQNQVVVRIERQNGLMFAGEVMSMPFIDDGLDQFRNRMLAQFWMSYAKEFLMRKSSDG